MARTPKRTSKEGIKTDIGGGVVQGVIGAQSVVIENLTFYSRAAEEPAQTAGTEPIGACPYPGLAYFGPSDADQFFGRDAAITRLAEAVGRQSFTALVGASGSGKSSVVLAGLAPRLHSDSAGNWRFSHFRIGTELESNPFLALARALAPLYVATDSDVERLKNTKLLATSLAVGELTLRDVFADCRSRNKGRRILLIADQFEEAFTLVEDEAVRHRFIDVLLAGFPDPAAGGVPDICLILTMRADFYGRALRYRPLADALQNHVENLGPMNREELRAAIVRPAENAGVAFEPGMVETLLDTVQSKPGGLPLLQFALREMWRRQERKKITRKNYDEIGGVEGALAQRAETVFAVQTKNGADPAMDKAFQRLFTRLVTLGEGQEDTRRVVERAELGDEVWGLAQRLAGEENRLVVTNASSARETAEVVHEALIRHWPKLVDWINRDRAFQSWLRQIGSNIELWSANPTDEGPLLRGGMLAQATDWLARRRDDLSPKERAYIEASVALSRRVEEEKEAALAREQARDARLRRMVTVSVAAVIVVLAGGLIAVYLQGQEAGLQRDFAQRTGSRFLANRADQYTDQGDAGTGMLLALEALPDIHGGIERPPVPEAEAALFRAYQAIRESIVLPHEKPLYSASFAPDGRHIVTASEDNTARLWNAENGDRLATLDEHTGAVRVAAFSPDGRHLITASTDGTARLWTVETAKRSFVLEHGGAVRSAAFSPDSRRVVTASNDNTARVWDAGTGNLERVLEGHTKAVRVAAFSPDGRRVLTASDDNTARIWNAETGHVERVLEGHTGSVRGATFSPDGHRAITTSTDKTARLWNLETHEQPSVLQHGGVVLSAAFSPNSGRVVTASEDTTARIWDVHTGQPIADLGAHGQRHGEPVNSAIFSPDGLRVLTASDDKTARIWEADSGDLVTVFVGHLGPVQGAGFSPDGTYILTASADGTARLWSARIDTVKPIAIIAGHNGAVRSAAFSPDGGRVVTASDDSTARLWNAESGRPISPFQGHTGRVYDAAFGPDGKRIVTAGDDNTARVWDVETGKTIAVLKGHTGPVWSAAFSPDGRRVVTASVDKTARVWDAATGKSTAILAGHNGALRGAAFSLDGVRVVTTSDDSTVRLWNTESGKQTAHFEGHFGQVYGAAFRPDGKRIVTAGTDNTARVWDAETGKTIAVLEGHTGAVYRAMFSPDGQRVVTASDDKTARVWDADAGKTIAVLVGHAGPVWSAGFSPDGDRIVTASDDNTARIWRVFPTLAALVDHSKAVVPRCLTPEQRAEAFLDPKKPPPAWCRAKWPFHSSP